MRMVGDLTPIGRMTARDYEADSPHLGKVGNILRERHLNLLEADLPSVTQDHRRLVIEDLD
jgi:hypothetical protein